MKQYTMEKRNTDVQALWEGKCNAKLRQQRVLEGLQGLGSKGLLPWWWWSTLPSPVCRGPGGAHPWGGALLASKQLPAHQLWPRRPRALPYPGPLHPLPHRGASQPCRVGANVQVCSFLGHFPLVLKAATALVSWLFLLSSESPLTG